MILNDTSDLPAFLLDSLKGAAHVVVFTGAGVSAESGIPTFRDALSGVWKNFDQEMLATPKAFRRDPAEVWGWYEWRRKLVMRAQPNGAHFAIARLANLVPELTVITQNVDDLHERAGSKNVIHLHGSLFRPRCFACARPHELAPDGPEVPDGGAPIAPPRCARCNGRIRPGVVWFGEVLDRKVFADARNAARHCDVLICIGASGEVQPAATLPREAARRGALVLQITPLPTKLDEVARFNLRMLAGMGMEHLLSAWGDRMPAEVLGFAGHEDERDPRV